MYHQCHLPSKKNNGYLALVLPLDANLLIIFIQCYVPAAGYKRVALFPTVYSFDVAFLIAVAITWPTRCTSV